MATTQPTPDIDPSKLTHDDLPTLLAYDTCVKVAGCDIDGILRGKIISKTKFLSVAASGFGFCSIVFGWDMHDTPYFRELGIANSENGYRDILAEIDLASFRRIPWEHNVPFFLCSFREPGGESLSACPRSLLERAVGEIEQEGVRALAGIEYEFFNFRVPALASTPSNTTNSTATASYLDTHPAHTLPHLTQGKLGYSLTDPVQNQDWYYAIYDACTAFRCDIEGWHTESGPGLFEAALAYAEIRAIADRAALFKLAAKAVSARHGISSSFMAKPRTGLQGTSGHIHLSLVDASSGANLFARETPDPHPPYPDLTHVSDTGRHFLAGLLDGLPDIMPLLAPNINSYKRLVENNWAPVTVSWGLEQRLASIRLIAPPTSSPSATRFEIRVPGADANPYLVLSAILALGWRGVQRKLDITLPPLGKGAAAATPPDPALRLPRSLKDATERFARPGSVAREVLGDAFVEHFTGTREHEVRLWDEAVTDWEVKRYLEMV